MIIKSYKCNRFAGIKDKSITFEDNLNVILGPNEAGKSTVVEGIYSVLFKSSKLGNKSIEDKEFKSRFMPIQSGDTIDGEVVISGGSGEYALSREWGENSFSKLITPGGQILKDEEGIRDALADVMQFGEATYNSIFFSRQINIKDAIEKIVKNSETTGEVSSILRKAIMELDGVSIDRLDQKINEDIDNLLKRWDMDMNYPESNKGISNPYKVGIGEVVESFYSKETTRKAMKEALKAEEDIEKIYKEMTETESLLADLKTKKDSMGQIEDDVIKRAQIDPEIQKLNNLFSDLNRVNSEWPRNEEKITRIEEELRGLNEKLADLEKEKVLASKGAEKQGLEKIIGKISELNTRLAEAEKTLMGVKSITAEDITALEKDHRGMLTAEAKMKAGKMFGKLNQLSSGAEVFVTKDLEERVKLGAGEAFDADGYIKIEIGDAATLELKSGDIDFNELRNQYKGCKDRLAEGLQKLEAGTVEEAKLNKEKQDDLKRNLVLFKGQITELTGEDSYEGLVQKVKEIEGLGKTKSLAEIEAEIKEITEMKIGKITDKKTIENILEKWVTEYNNTDGLLNVMVDTKISLKAAEEKLGKLAPMPEGTASADSFRKELSDLRIAHEEAQGRLAGLKQKYYEIEKNMPESTAEELVKTFEMEESNFEGKLAKGKKLLKIKAAFEATRSQMDEASFNPVIESFSKYLSMMTKDAYQVKEIDNGFNFKIDKNAEATIPLTLLSTGTYDSVALALRLALLESILADSKGFMVLDDCLVDLDPYRKEMAVKMIQEFAKKHQVIFTTCSPETARELGGNLVGM